MRQSRLPLLKIFPLGFSERSRNTLLVFFERQLMESCVISEQDIADVSMIDFDAKDAKLLIEKELAIRPDQPRILLTYDPEHCNVPGATLVQKPVEMKVLLKILKNLRNKIFQPSTVNANRLSTILSHNSPANRSTALTKMRSASNLAAQAARHLHSRERHVFISASPDIDLENTQERKKVFYDPGHFLQGFVQKAVILGIENASVVRLSGSIIGSIEIYPFARKAVTKTPTHSLSAISRLPIRGADVSIELLPGAPHFPPEYEDSEALDTFLWKLALWASRGRIPLGTDLNTPFVLKRWPNLTRLLAPPHATQIASLWAREPIVLSQSLSTLGIPQRYVFALYSACLVHGIVTPAKRALDPLHLRPPVRQKKRNLIRRLTDKLTGNIARKSNRDNA